MAVLVLVAVWVIATGVLELLAAVQLRRVIHGEWVLAACGLLSVVLGVYFIAQPGAGLVALVWVFGLYSLISGMRIIGDRLRFLMGFRGRKRLESPGGCASLGSRNPVICSSYNRKAWSVPMTFGLLVSMSTCSGLASSS